MDNKHRVLVADGDPKNLAAMSRVLQAADMVVLGASTGEECLETAAMQQPDLILVDAALSDVSGIDLIKELKRDPDLAPIYAVLMLGAETAPNIQARALESGADGFILRSLPEREALAWVNAFLRRKRERDDVLRNLRQYQLAVDAVSDPMFVVDTQWNITLCNVALSKTLRLAPSQILGKRCYELIHAEAEAMPGCLLRAVRESDRRETEVVATRDGWLHIVADPLRADDGHITGAVHILLDGTDQHRLQQRVVELEQTVSAAQQELADTEAARKEIRQALRETELDLGMRTDELNAALAQREKTDKELARTRSELEESLAAGQELDRQLLQQRSLLAAAGAALLQEKDQHRKTQGLVQHYRAQKTTALGAMANGLASSLHSLSSSLLGGTAAALAQVEPGHPLHRELQRMHESALSSLDLARDLLALAGQRVVQMKLVDINALLSQAADSLQLSLERQAKTRVELTPDIPRINGDANALQATVATLLREALRSTPATAEVVVSSDLIEPGRRPDDLLSPSAPVPSVRVRFQMPVPIAEAMLDTYFDPFPTGGAVTPASEGLALSVARGIVLQHKGLVRVANVDGGSAIELYFPVSESVTTQIVVSDAGSAAEAADAQLETPQAGNDAPKAALGVTGLKRRVKRALERRSTSGA